MEPVGKVCCGCARVVMKHHHRDRGRNKQETGRLTRNGERTKLRSHSNKGKHITNAQEGKGRGGEGDPEQQRL